MTGKNSPATAVFQILTNKTYIKIKTEIRNYS